MNTDFAVLARLKNDHGYKLLEALWIHQVSEVEKSRDSAAKRGTESAWRYHAGREAGFKLAMTALERALLAMEKEGLAEEPTGYDVNQLLEELKGERK